MDHLNNTSVDGTSVSVRAPSIKISVKQSKRRASIKSKTFVDSKKTI